ncbi:nuclear transport factor 2 family protein [Salinilacihabitans rarus]|uniref:nuclear transport factor 2 family protein n=1 Tax=Salinilacihabitans rarus TaxID=2961596 RepID=UPI0020C8443B|nr:nuclear transport factor 2 family protein [Salinilacihabitans rarus]
MAEATDDGGADGPESIARAYYDALDGGDYDALASLLAPEFVQRRPDRTFEGREAFVRFMREGRPNPDTRHELREVVGDEGRVAVRGRLLDRESGAELLAFADHFAVADGRIVRIETYTR